MKALLISIRPQWVELILNYIKKDEIRKGTAIGKAINRLIKEQGVAPMLIYCTKELPLLLKNKDSGKIFINKLKAVEKDDLDRFPHIQKFNGKVVARFNATAEHIEYETCSRDISGWWKDDGKMYDHKDACLTYKEMFDYIGAGEGTVVHINDLEIFDKPKEISEFKSIKKNIVSTKIGSETFEVELDNSLTRAPESYQFIEI